MSERELPIPPAREVQRRLADNLREGRLLRRQLRLSMTADDLRTAKTAASKGSEVARGA